MPYTATEDSTPHELIAESGAPALLLRELAGRTRAAYALAHRIATSRICSAGRSTWPRPTRCWSERATRTCGWWTTDEAEEGGHAYHLIPATASKAAAVALHMRARGFAREECIAVGDSLEDMGVAPLVGRFYLVANAPAGHAPNVERTESGWGDGFYEAVVASLVGAG